VKILINFAGWFWQGMDLKNILPVVGKAMSVSNVWKPSRWSIPFFSPLSFDERGWGICSTRIDFQLGTNGGDANSVAVAMEALISNIVTFSACSARRVHGGSTRRYACAP
jgi:hypothetical protein